MKYCFVHNAGRIRVAACLVVILSSILFSYGPALGLEYRGKLTTIIETYQFGEKTYAVPVYQYLNLSVEKPLGSLGEYNYFYFYGRLAEDLADRDSTQSELYSAFIDVRGLAPHLDARAGRQFLYTSAGSAILDGLMLDLYSENRAIALKVFGGSEAHFEDEYERGDWLAGASADLTLKNASAGLSYMQSYDAWNKAKEAVGASASYTFDSVLRLYAEGRFDLLSESIDTSVAGVKVYASKDTTVSLEYDYSYPVFEATDVYVVFASTRREAVTLNVDTRYNEYVNLFVSATQASYKDDGDAQYVEPGIYMRKYKGISAEASFRVYSGDDRMVGAKVAGAYDVTDKFTLGAGLESDNYEYFEMEDDELATLGYVEGEYEISDSMTAYALLEYYTSLFYENDGVRGKLKFSYNF